MDKKQAIVRMLKDFKSEVNRELSIEKLIFFGSRATGKPHKYSDIDLIIVSKNFRKWDFIRRSAKMYDYWKSNYPVDFLCYTPEEFEKFKKRVSIVSMALKEGIAI